MAQVRCPMVVRNFFSYCLINPSLRLISLFLSLGLSFTQAATAFAGDFRFSPQETLNSLASLTNQHIARSVAPVTPLVEHQSNQPIYVYGETSEPYQIGKEYLVFTRNVAHPEQIIGAVYLPDAEYNCFSGTISQGRIDMNLVDNYEGTTHPYSVSIEPTDLVAAILPLRSRSYQPVKEINNHDLEMVKTCQSSLQPQLN